MSNLLSNKNIKETNRELFKFINNKPTNWFNKTQQRQNQIYFYNFIDYSYNFL